MYIGKCKNAIKKIYSISIDNMCIYINIYVYILVCAYNIDIYVHM